MRILPFHKGYRFRLPHWQRYQFIDVLYASENVIFATDETNQNWEGDNHHTSWICLGTSPLRKPSPPDERTNITR